MFHAAAAIPQGEDGQWVEQARLSPPGGPIFSLALDSREQDGLPNQVGGGAGQAGGQTERGAAVLLQVLHEHRQLHCMTGNLRASRVGASAGMAMPPPTQLSAPHLQCSLSICAAWQVFVGNHAKQVAAWVPPAAELDSNVSRSPPPSGWAGCSCCCCLTWLSWDGRAVLRAAPRQRVCAWRPA